MNSSRSGQLYSLALGVIAILGQAPFHLWFITIICVACLVARLKLAREKSENKKLKLENITQEYRSNDQRYGVIESATDLEQNILSGVESKPMPEGLDYIESCTHRPTPPY